MTVRNRPANQMDAGLQLIIPKSHSEGGVSPFFHYDILIVGNKVGLPKLHVPLPNFWEAELTGFYHNRTQFPASMGRISYGYKIPIFGGYNSHVGVTEGYWPKDQLPKGTCKGLPYYLEMLTTQDMAENGFTHIKTSRAPSESRRKQLERVGLPVRTVVPVEDWLKGLLRGVESVTQMTQQPLLV